MGAGWNVDEHAAYGIPFPLDRRTPRPPRGGDPGPCRRSGPAGPASLDGRFYPLRDAECYPKPAQQPLPLLVGGNGERRTLRIVAQYANEWNGIYLDVDAYREKRAVLERHCEAVGRDPASIAHSLMLGFVIGRDQDEIAQRLSRLSANPILSGLDSAGDIEPSLARLRRRGWLVGSPAQIVEQLGRLAEEGVARVMLHHLDKDDFAALDLVAAEVLPQLLG